MTLQERLRESAKELVRLLEEDMKQIEEGKIPSVSVRVDNGKAFVAREFESERTYRPLAHDAAANRLERLFNFLKDEGVPVTIKLQNGVANVNFQTSDHATQQFVLQMNNDKENRLRRMEEKIDALEKQVRAMISPQTDQPQEGTPTCYHNGLHLCPARGLENAPVCLSIVCSCAHRDESPYPEGFVIVVKPGESLHYDLVKPKIGQEDRDKEPQTPESSSEDMMRTPGQEET